MGWRPIKDEKILHRWRCVCDGNSIDPENISFDSEIEELNASQYYTVELEPSWYQNNGTPVCMLCDSDMTYIETLLDCKFDPMRETLVVPIKKQKQKNGS
tara:strand:- start:210 stop:509 length:300 start_codon:yes stop_codon:yes gene_type:complete